MAGGLYGAAGVAYSLNRNRNQSPREKPVCSPAPGRELSPVGVGLGSTFDGWGCKWQPMLATSGNLLSRTGQCVTMAREGCAIKSPAGAGLGWSVSWLAPPLRMLAPVPLHVLPRLLQKYRQCCGLLWCQAAFSAASVIHVRRASLLCFLKIAPPSDSSNTPTTAGHQGEPRQPLNCYGRSSWTGYRFTTREPLASCTVKSGRLVVTVPSG